MKLKTVLITCGVCLLPMLLGILTYNQLPNQIPIHWNIAGEIDGYASKAIFVFLLPVLMCGVQLLSLFMMSADPKYKNYSAKMARIVIWIIPFITIILEFITYAIVFGYNISVNIVIPMCIGVLFIVLGNYLPKCRQNFTLGYRLPWTLNDEDNWNKSNRLAGYIMVIGGFLVIILSIFDLAFWAILGFIPVFLLVPAVYSFLLYHKKL
ncbi:SdpI family protein [Thomasclavelia sp.]